MKAQDRVVKDWLSIIRTRQLGLPRFQRFEAWGHKIIGDFWSSIVRELPVGVALILEIGDSPQFKYRFISGTEDTGQRLNELLLDGQQRLTALWRALIDNYDDRIYLLGGEGEEGESFDWFNFDFENDIGRLYVYGESRWITDDEVRKPVWVYDPAKCFAKGRIPLRILNPDETGEYQEWCKTATQGNHEHELKLIYVVNYLRNSIGQYNIPYLQLPSNTEKSVAIDVFIKLNTSYEELTVFDIIVAQVEEELEISLHDLLNNLRSEVPEIDSYTKTERFVLAVAALMQDKTPSEQGYLKLDLSKLKENWSNVVTGTRELIGFLEEEGIYDNERLPVEPILASVAALLSTEFSTDKAGERRILLKKYLWRGFFSNRYDHSVSTSILSDYRALREVLSENLQENKVPIFTGQGSELPSIESISGAGWPKKRDRLGRAILALSLKFGAIDFADAEKVSRRNIVAREYHHLYPNSFLEERGIAEKERFRALNCALISWKTNRAIAARSPLQYLLERTEATQLGEDEIRRRLASHLIDYGSFVSEKYDEFIASRTSLIYEKMLEVCGRIIGDMSLENEGVVSDHTADSKWVPRVKEIIIYSTGPAAKAKAALQTDGRVRVFKGSRARIRNAPSFEDHKYYKIKNTLISEAVLTPDGNSYVFSQDHVFESPSAAAAVVLGRSANGLKEWKTKRNQELGKVIAHGNEISD